MIMVICALIPILVLWIVLTQPTWSPSSEAGSNPIDPTRLEAHVRMLSETLFPRDSGHTENLDRAAAYIRKELEAAGGRVSDQPFEADGSIYRNVIAHFGPDTGERIVIGAHYDAYGELPGADDNAGAVAGLIELAHLLGKTPLRTFVELVAYTLEEPPYFRTSKMGSAVHADWLKNQGIPVRVMVCLEMIGYFSDAKGSQEYPLPLLRLFYPSRGNFIAVVGNMNQLSAVRRVKKAMKRASSLPVYSINAPMLVPGIDLSDHRNYWQAGYNAVMITDTSFYRNKNYHTLGDTSDTLDYGRIVMVVQGVYASVLAFDSK